MISLDLRQDYLHIAQNYVFGSGRVSEFEFQQSYLDQNNSQQWLTISEFVSVLDLHMVLTAIHIQHTMQLVFNMLLHPDCAISERGKVWIVESSSLTCDGILRNLKIWDLRPNTKKISDIISIMDSGTFLEKNGFRAYKIACSATIRVALDLQISYNKLPSTDII